MELLVENLIFLFVAGLGLIAVFIVKWHRSSAVVYKYPLAGYLIKNLTIASGLKLKLVNFLRILSILAALLLGAKIVTLEVCRNVFVNSVDIVLVLDMSGSMMLYDDPKADRRSRFQAAKSVALDFIAKRPNDQIGVIGFAKDAITVSPITLDKNMLTVAVSRLDIGYIDSNQTNISQALGLSIARLKNSTSKSKIIVLLTDGKPNVNGDLTIERAISIAKESGIKIYTVGVGNSSGAYFPDNFGGFAWQNAEGVDTELLTLIANGTGGKFFQANKPKDVEAAYRAIDQLEKSKVNADLWNNCTEIFWPFAYLLVITLFLENVLKFFWRGIW